MRLAPPLLAVLLVAGCLQAPEAAPDESTAHAVLMERGADAEGPFLTGFRLAPSGDAFSAALRGVAGGRLHADELLRLRAADGRAHEVRFHAPPADAPGLREAVLTFLAPDGAPLARLDLRDAAPAAAFVLPAEGAVRVAWTLTFAEDAAGLDVSHPVTMDVAG